jgi:pimeloyl-ACP methyl ester carboxylesterase
MWCTPPRPRSGTRANDRGIPAGNLITVPVNGRQVVAQTWGSGPIVYLVHGWGGWRGQLGSFVSPLVAAGYQVVTYDALSHGDSDPGILGARRSALPEIASTLTAVVGAVGPAYGIIAHSLGGSATTMALLDGLTARKLVFIGPLADPVAYTSDFAKVFGFGERIRSEMLERVERISDWPVSSYNLPARLSQLNEPADTSPSQPRSAADRGELPALLVIHDLEDKEVAHADGQTLATLWPGGELVTTKGLGHRRILRDEEVVDQAVAYLTAA